MNNSKIWLVVKPTVGVPLFLSAVAVGSFAVHVAVLSNTSWVADFLSGQELGSSMDTASVILDDGAIAPSAASLETNGAVQAGQEILVTLPDGSTATAIIQPTTVLASAKTQLPVVIE
jgi:light-harvesting protein B-800-850 alpha chain